MEDARLKNGNLEKEIRHELVHADWAVLWQDGSLTVPLERIIQYAVLMYQRGRIDGWTD